jgi:hypothetical protein
MSAAFVIEKFAPVIRNTLRGFAVRMPSGMVLHDVAIHQGNLFSASIIAAMRDRYPEALS